LIQSIRAIYLPLQNEGYPKKKNSETENELDSFSIPVTEFGIRVFANHPK